MQLGDKTSARVQKLMYLFVNDDECELMVNVPLGVLFYVQKSHQSQTYQKIGKNSSNENRL